MRGRAVRLGNGQEELVKFPIMGIAVNAVKAETSNSARISHPEKGRGFGTRDSMTGDAASAILEAAF